MSERIKTTTTVTGLQQIDEFDALCILLGRRRHELASDMVWDAIRAYRDNPDVAPFVKIAVKARRDYRREQAGTALHLVKGDGG